MAPITSSDVTSSPAKSKSDRKIKKEKKRSREEENGLTPDGARKHKKSKSVSEQKLEEIDTPIKDKKKHKKGDIQEAEENGLDVKEKKKKKKHEDDPEKAERKRLRKERKEREKLALAATQDEEEEEEEEEEDHMEVDPAPVPTPVKPKSKARSSHIYQPPDIPAEPQFPFYTQTVSLYEPLYPVGWAQPVTNAQAQHLQHLQNRYVPALQGVLLDYRNVTFGENPGRSGAAADDETATTVISKNEAAVGFGWITADMDIFKPSRGAWMEGSISLQTEGHIGVTCFGRFNASVEASRLPPTWKWIANDDAMHGFEETASVFTADEHGVTRQIHSTGYWVDENEDKVTGKIRYRIRNYDIGVSGDTSYLSLEGTMLDKKSERKLVEEEAKVVQMRRANRGNGKGYLAKEKRKIPDFAMTRFAMDDKDKESSQNEAERKDILKNPDQDEQGDREEHEDEEEDQHESADEVVQQEDDEEMEEEEEEEAAKA